ncbi:MAG TPA: hypothetical protein PLC50_13665, partial [Alicycliphilus sp.]|nr:hypothetical protein [Alicycliphilus sp.]
MFVLHTFGNDSESGGSQKQGAWRFSPVQVAIVLFYPQAPHAAAPAGAAQPAARFCRISKAGSCLPSSTSRKAPPP